MLIFVDFLLLAPFAGLAASVLYALLVLQTCLAVFTGLYFYLSLPNFGPSAVYSWLCLLNILLVLPSSAQLNPTSTQVNEVNINFTFYSAPYPTSPYPPTGKVLGRQFQSSKFQISKEGLWSAQLKQSTKLKS